MADLTPTMSEETGEIVAPAPRGPAGGPDTYHGRRSRRGSYARPTTNYEAEFELGRQASDTVDHTPRSEDRETSADLSGRELTETKSGDFSDVGRGYSEPVLPEGEITLSHGLKASSRTFTTLPGMDTDFLASAKRARESTSDLDHPHPSNSGDSDEQTPSPILTGSADLSGHPSPSMMDQLTVGDDEERSGTTTATTFNEFSPSAQLKPRQKPISAGSSSSSSSSSSSTTASSSSSMKKSSRPKHSRSMTSYASIHHGSGMTLSELSSRVGSDLLSDRLPMAMVSEESSIASGMTLSPRSSAATGTGAGSSRAKHRHMRSHSQNGLSDHLGLSFSSGEVTMVCVKLEMIDKLGEYLTSDKFLKAVNLYRKIIKTNVFNCGGQIFEEIVSVQTRTAFDYFIVFDSIVEAVKFASQVQLQFHKQEWPMFIREFTQYYADEFAGQPPTSFGHGLRVGMVLHSTKLDSDVNPFDGSNESLKVVTDSTGTAAGSALSLSRISSERYEGTAVDLVKELSNSLVCGGEVLLTQPSKGLLTAKTGKDAEEVGSAVHSVLLGRHYFDGLRTVTLFRMELIELPDRLFAKKMLNNGDKRGSMSASPSGAIAIASTAATVGSIVTDDEGYATGAARDSIPGLPHSSSVDTFRTLEEDYDPFPLGVSTSASNKRVRDKKKEQQKKRMKKARSMTVVDRYSEESSPQPVSFSVSEEEKKSKEDPSGGAGSAAAEEIGPIRRPRSATRSKRFSGLLKQPTLDVSFDGGSPLKDRRSVTPSARKLSASHHSSQHRRERSKDDSALLSIEAPRKAKTSKSGRRGSKAGPPPAQFFASGDGGSNPSSPKSQSMSLGGSTGTGGITSASAKRLLKFYDRKPERLPKEYDETQDLFHCINCRKAKAWSDGCWRVSMWPLFDICFDCGRGELSAATAAGALRRKGSDKLTMFNDGLDLEAMVSSAVASGHGGSGPRGSFSDIASGAVSAAALSAAAVGSSKAGSSSTSAMLHRRIGSVSGLTGLISALDPSLKTSGPELAERYGSVIDLCRKQLSQTVESLVQFKQRLVSNMLEGYDKRVHDESVYVQGPKEEMRDTQDEIRKWREKRQKHEEHLEISLKQMDNVSKGLPASQTAMNDLEEAEILSQFESYSVDEDFRLINRLFLDVGRLRDTEEELWHEKIEYLERNQVTAEDLSATMQLSAAIPAASAAADSVAAASTTTTAASSAASIDVGKYDEQLSEMNKDDLIRVIKELKNKHEEEMDQLISQIQRKQADLSQLRAQMVRLESRQNHSGSVFDGSKSSQSVAAAATSAGGASAAGGGRSMIRSTSGASSQGSSPSPSPGTRSPLKEASSSREASVESDLNGALQMRDAYNSKRTAAAAGGSSAAVAASASASASASVASAAPVSSSTSVSAAAVSASAIPMAGSGTGPSSSSYSSSGVEETTMVVRGGIGLGSLFTDEAQMEYYAAEQAAAAMYGGSTMSPPSTQSAVNAADRAPASSLGGTIPMMKPGHSPRFSTPIEDQVVRHLREESLGTALLQPKRVENNVKYKSELAKITDGDSDDEDSELIGGGASSSSAAAAASGVVRMASIRERSATAESEVRSEDDSASAARMRGLSLEPQSSKPYTNQSDHSTNISGESFTISGLFDPMLKPVDSEKSAGYVISSDDDVVVKPAGFLSHSQTRQLAAFQDNDSDEPAVPESGQDFRRISPMAVSPGSVKGSESIQDALMKVEAETQQLSGFQGPLVGLSSLNDEMAKIDDSSFDGIPTSGRISRRPSLLLEMVKETDTPDGSLHAAAVAAAAVASSSKDGGTRSQSITPLAAEVDDEFVEVPIGSVRRGRKDVGSDPRIVDSPASTSIMSTAATGRGTLQMIEAKLDEAAATSTAAATTHTVGGSGASAQGGGAKLDFSRHPHHSHHQAMPATSMMTSAAAPPVYPVTSYYPVMIPMTSNGQLLWPASSAPTHPSTMTMSAPNPTAVSPMAPLPQAQTVPAPGPLATSALSPMHHTYGPELTPPPVLDAARDRMIDKLQTRLQASEDRVEGLELAKKQLALSANRAMESMRDEITALSLGLKESHLQYEELKRIVLQTMPAADELKEGEANGAVSVAASGFSTMLSSVVARSKWSAPFWKTTVEDTEQSKMMLLKTTSVEMDRLRKIIKMLSDQLDTAMDIIAKRQGKSTTTTSSSSSSSSAGKETSAYPISAEEDDSDDSSSAGYRSGRKHRRKRRKRRDTGDSVFTDDQQMIAMESGMGGGTGAHRSGARIGRSGAGMSIDISDVDRGRSRSGRKDVGGPAELDRLESVPPTVKKRASLLPPDGRLYRSYTYEYPLNPDMRRMFSSQSIGSLPGLPPAPYESSPLTYSPGRPSAAYYPGMSQAMAPHGAYHH